MLKLVNIKKDYKVGDGLVHALKGISLTFRNSEFVSILGPSGCGKTTMLNIIGGLDHYTEGDLIIDYVSTKEYGDRDWDTYRNHKIGFIFQSYNLIPHQSILENVELALNISGVDKETRVRKAKKALDEVGLKDQYDKKPNQLSGGQCQRVAIARALVNEPEILLADEPTGALDTVTSVQIMELIKKISEDRLVIMVTHNPELAEKYSTRIIRLLDGEIQDDTNAPLEEEKITLVKEPELKKAKLGFWSSFKLSARNLRSKFKRTAMVCFAGSIGIIGVASVLSVSTGVQGYIKSMQDDMLSGNPITISEEAMDLNKIMNTSMKKDVIDQTLEDGYVNVDKIIEFLLARGEDLNSFTVKNDITKEYVDYVHSMPEDLYSSIIDYYGIDIGNNIFTDIDFEYYNGPREMSLTSILTSYNKMLESTDFADMAGYIGMIGDAFVQAPSDEDFILSQYDIISNPETSKVATKANEIMIVVNEDTQLTDLVLAQLGYYTQEEFFNKIYHYNEDPAYDPALEKDSFSYEELMGKNFTWYPNDRIFTKTDPSLPQASTHPFTYNPMSSEEWDDGFDLQVTAILRPKKGIEYGALKSGFYYTEDFTKMVIQNSLNSEIVNYIKDTNGSMIDSYEIYHPETGVLLARNGVTYSVNYLYKHGDDLPIVKENVGALLGKADMMSAMMQNGIIRYDMSLRAVGGKELPNRIAIYPVNFNMKDEVTAYLDVWNSDHTISFNDIVITPEQRQDIAYTDNLSIVINMINGMINIVTYALVAFTSLSLVVSTVMIAIITYVSVIERVKEIGVIRALGGRKKDVSRLFNAETFIIGGISGAIGIGITYLLSFILNMIVGGLTGIYTIAHLTIPTSLIMILISILLTSISGLIPAKLAAKKDPVDALRSE